MESIIEGQETLIPAIVSVILSIDKEENLMIVCLPEWY
jgi:ribosomal 30S subunit maturation factor RimM